ncbi:MAG: DUF6089 family protein [Chitinophagaceae bacterium]
MRFSPEKTLTYSILLSLSSLNLTAQSNSSKYEMGINVGTFIYQGDLTPNAYGSLKTPSFVLGINGSKRLSNAFAIRLDLNIGKLKGDESTYSNPAWRKQRAFAFKSPVTEIIASAVFHPLGTGRMLSPFLFAGFGYSFLKIRRDYSRYNAAYFSSESLDAALNVDIEQSLPKGVPIFPLGIGVRFSLTSRLSLSSEASYRFMSNDYLDGFSQSGNPDRKDHYYKYAVGFIYSFAGISKYGCPVIKQ